MRHRLGFSRVESKFFFPCLSLCRATENEDCGIAVWFGQVKNFKLRYFHLRIKWCFRFFNRTIYGSKKKTVYCKIITAKLEIGTIQQVFGMLRKNEVLDGWMFFNIQFT
jgi:hypothetical protein